MTAAEQLTNGLVHWLTEHDVHYTLLAIGAESTNLNTGRHKGAIQYVERKLGRRLIWLICALHANEQPLRHLIKKLEGKTASDRSWRGHLGFRAHLGHMVNRADDLPINPNF